MITTQVVKIHLDTNEIKSVMPDRYQDVVAHGAQQINCLSIVLITICSLLPSLLVTLPQFRCEYATVMQFKKKQPFFFHSDAFKEQNLVHILNMFLTFTESYNSGRF